MFGFQFRPPMDDTTAAIAGGVNTHPAHPVPRGRRPAERVGEHKCATIFRADFTYATGIVKIAGRIHANAAYGGRLRYLDIWVLL
jgi:hypothetical protein